MQVPILLLLGVSFPLNLRATTSICIEQWDKLESTELGDKKNHALA